MKLLCCFCLLWLVLLPPALSSIDEDRVKRRKLCGRYLLLEIIRICGTGDWSQFKMSKQTPMMHLAPQSSQNVKTFSPDRIPSLAWGRFKNPAHAGASQEKAINTWEAQSQPDYQFEKANLLPKAEFSSHDMSAYGERAKLQKKRTNKINAFEGDHPQRVPRGFADKCCQIGCTKPELAVACIP
ncbi:insulin-like peptide INSL6 [Acomys russatus]|uniref:insulin-like peptide INSL6 n=1 Tax=Acomys russatus TaxID=60746 RepID=UPI0021E31E48|nr:insulin-like peptide INSL6 [Acomys russatus]